MLFHKVGFNSLFILLELEFSYKVRFLNSFFFSLSLSFPAPLLFEAVTLWKLRVRFQDSKYHRSSFCHTWLCAVPKAKTVISETFKKSPDRYDMQKKQFWRNKGIKSRRQMPWGPFHRRLKGKSVVLQKHLFSCQLKFESRKFLLTIENCTDLRFPVFQLQVTCHL